MALNVQKHIFVCDFGLKFGTIIAYKWAGCFGRYKAGLFLAQRVFINFTIATTSFTISAEVGHLGGAKRSDASIVLWLRTQIWHDFCVKVSRLFWEIQGSIILGITNFHQYYNCDSQLRNISKSKPFRWRQTFRQINVVSTSEAFVSCFFHQSEPGVLAARRQESCFNFVFEHACRLFFSATKYTQ